MNTEYGTAFYSRGTGRKGGSRGGNGDEMRSTEHPNKSGMGWGKRRMRVTQRVQWCKMEGRMHKERGKKIDVVKSNKGNCEMREEGL